MIDVNDVVRDFENVKEAVENEDGAIAIVATNGCHCCNEINLDTKGYSTNP